MKFKKSALKRTTFLIFISLMLITITSIAAPPTKAPSNWKKILKTTYDIGNKQIEVINSTDFNITINDYWVYVKNTVDVYVIGDFLITQEWGYVDGGYTILTSNSPLDLIGDTICVSDLYTSNGQGFAEQKHYSHCVYFPEQTFVTNITLPNTTVINTTHTARNITVLDDYTVRIDFADLYDPTSTNMTTGLEAFYNFNQNESGNDVFDGDNDWTLNGGTIVSSAKLGDGALFCDGSNDKPYLNAVDTTYTSVASISLWGNKNDSWDANGASVFYGNTGSDGGGDTGWILGYSSPGNEPNVWVDSNGAASWTNTDLDAGEIPTTGAWHHYVLTSDGTTIRYYIDGVNVENLTDALGTGANDYLCDYNNAFAKTNIDELGIWKNVVLSYDDVQQLYNNGDGWAFPFVPDASNNAPTVELYNPTNNTAYDLSNPHILNASYNDTDADAGTVYFYNQSNGVAWCTNTSVTANTRVYCALTLTYADEVKWQVNVSDGTDTANSGISNFSININHLPNSSNYAPANNTLFELNNPHLISAIYNDGDSDLGTVTFINNSNAATFCQNTSVADGTNVTCALTLAEGNTVKWYVNVSDGVVVNKSGVYNFSINTSATTPGTLTVNWYSHLANLNQSQNTLVTYQVNVSCDGGSCENINVTLDPPTVQTLRFNATHVATGAVQNKTFDPSFSQANWTNTINATRGAVDQSVGSCVGTGIVSGNHFTVDRFFAPINTSALPDDINIQSVEYFFFPYIKNNNENDGDDFIVLTTQNQTSVTSLDGSDYYNIFKKSPIEISNRIDLGSITVQQWNSWNLTPTGKSYINLTGYTKLLMRAGHDINEGTKPAIEPSNNLCWFYTNTSVIPYIEVNYTVGKGGAISTTPGTTPFFSTNESNPTGGCGNMGDGDECILGLQVNATGTVGNSYDFFWIVESDGASVTDVNSSTLSVTIDGNTTATDSCTYSSGTWEIDCSDNCGITSAVDLNNNSLSISGTGTVSVEADITECKNSTIRGTDATNRCIVTVINSAKFCN